MELSLFDLPPGTCWPCTNAEGEIKSCGFLLEDKSVWKSHSYWKKPIQTSKVLRNTKLEDLSFIPVELV